MGNRIRETVNSRQETGGGRQDTMDTMDVRREKVDGRQET